MESRPINATIGFSQESTVSVLVIVMAVLGGVLLIALVIAVICIIKRRNANAGRISS
jgi:phage shock protein PspC (stress-responsive transcriptional regulator)